MMDIMGPLGHGFALLEASKKAIVVGGGIGVPPMLEVAATMEPVAGRYSASALLTQ